MFLITSKAKYHVRDFAKIPAYLLGEIRGFVDIPISFLLQLIDDLPLFLRLIFVILNFLFQVLLALFMQFH